MKGALAQYLEAALAASATPIATSDGESIAPRDLLANARAVAAELSGATWRLEPAEPVLLTITNRPADLAGMLGIWLAGGVAVPLHADAAASTAGKLQAATGARVRVDAGSLLRLADRPPPRRDLLADAALVIFTSGSTGEPKGVVIGHARMAGKLGVLAPLVGLRADDEVLVPLRLSFIFGIWVSLLALHHGARLVLMPRFSVEEVARAFAGGTTVLAAVPTMLRTLIAKGLPAAPHLRAILTGGESLGAALGGSLRAARPGIAIWDLYGLTETGSCDFCLTPAEQEAGAGSIGRPTGEVAFRLSDSDGQPVADGTAGELCIRTPFGMLGYLDNPALTAASFADGYLRTGDLGRLRTDGRVEIVGRLKDIIARGGNKIAPAEIDAVLGAHPDVAAALCAGLPDARLGESIHAVVVLKPGAQATADTLRSFVGERLERFKVPDAIHFRDALPLGATGKVHRGGVAALLQQEPQEQRRSEP